MSGNQGCFTIEIEAHSGDCTDRQKKYLVRGFDDVLWTDSLDAAMQYVRSEAERA